MNLEVNEKTRAERMLKNRIYQEVLTQWRHGKKCRTSKEIIETCLVKKSVTGKGY